MNIRRLMRFFIFLPCAIFAIALILLWSDNYVEIYQQSREFHDFLVSFVIAAFRFALIVHYTIPVAGIVVIKDLPVEIKSQEFCRNVNKVSWACLCVNLIPTSFILTTLIAPPDNEVFLVLIAYSFFPLGLLANLTQIGLNILLYRKYQHRFFLDTLKTQALMILTIVVSIVIVPLIVPHLE